MNPSFTDNIIAFAGIRNPVSSLSHLAGAVAAVIATWLLVRRSHGAKRVHLTVYGVSLVACMLASAAFHGVIAGWETVGVLLRLDLSAIYLLIGGTNVAIAYVGFEPGAPRQLALAAIAGLTTAGIVAQWIPSFIYLPFALRASSYVVLAWLGAAAMPRIKRSYGWRPLLLIAGGVAVYMTGPLCDVLHWPVVIPGVFESHELSHLTALGGAACMHAFIVRYVEAAP
jgi:hemolysin III